MSIEETRAHLNRQVRSAFAASQIEWSPAQKAQVDNLIENVTDAVLVEFDAVLGSMWRAGQIPSVSAAAPAAARAAGAGTGSGPAAGEPLPAEEILWQGRPFLSVGELYVVTTERVRMITGLVGKDTEDIELIRIQDVDHTQGIGERVLNIGDVTLHSTDKSNPDATLRNVTDPAKVHEIIRRAILDARRRYPFAFRQEI